MNNKVVIVTGGASGIGLAVARLFARNGYAVAIFDLRSSSESEEVTRTSGGLFRSVDIAKLDKTTEAVGEVISTLKRIDTLINSAGISKDAPLDKMTEEDWDTVINVDLKGTYNAMRAVAPIFKQQKHGKIVNIASTLALRARRNLVNYVAAKSGVIGLTKGAARDLGRSNVNVNAVAPGLVETPLTKDMAEDIKSRLRDETALGRLATPDDVANVILFLCSEEARHITGEVIRVDGGQLA